MKGPLRVVGLRPAAGETAEFLARTLKPGWLLTSLDDARLRVARDLVPDSLRDRIEIAPLGDVAGRVLMMHGVPAPRIATTGQLRAAFTRVLSQVPDDDPFAASAALPGLAAQLANEWPTWLHFGLTAQSLQVVAERLANEERPHLARHTNSLATIIARVEQELADKSRGPSTLRFRAALEREPTAHLTFDGLLVLAGSEEHPVAEKWCTWMALHGIPVVLAVDALAGSRLFPAGPRIASRLGVPLEPPEGSSWTDALFTDEVRGDAPELALRPAFDALAECEWALRGALARINAGANPSECALIVPNQEAYAPLATAAAQRLGVPLVAPLSVPLMTNGFARFIRDVMRAIVGEDIRDWGRVAKRSYIGHQPLMWTALETAIREAYQQEVNAYTSLAEYVRAKPSFNWLAVCLDWREKHRTATFPLRTWLNEFRVLIGVAGLAEVAGMGEGTAVERDRHAMTAIQRPLADEATLYGDQLFSLDEFVALAETRWEQEMVTVPAQTDGGVALVPMNAALRTYEHVWVLGLLEGTLPARRRENALLPDRVIHQLNELGIPLVDSHERARAERDRLARFVSMARTSLTLSYPLELDERDTVPTAYIDEIYRTAGTKAERKPYDRSMTLPALADCLALSDLRQVQARQGTPLDLPIPRLSHPDAMSAVRPDPTKGITADVLDDASSCLFRATARHLLGIRPPRSIRHGFIFYGLPQTAALHAAPDETAAKESMLAALEERLTAVMPDVAPGEAELLRRRGRREVQDWISQEFKGRKRLRREAAQIARQPIGSPSLQLTFDTKAGPVELRGQVGIVRHSPTEMHLVVYVPYIKKIKHVHKGVLELKDGENSNRWPPHWHLISILGAAAYTPQRQVITVECIGPRGQKMRVRFAPEKPKGNIAIQDDKVQDFTVVTTLNKLYSGGMKYGRKYFDRLLDATMQAQPGDHCDHCPFADLCRSKQGVGDLGVQD